MGKLRFIDDPFPGWEFIDAEARAHSLVDKAPMVTTDDLDALTVHPQPGDLRCTERWRDASGEELIKLTTRYPDPIETTERLSLFVVRSSQVSGIPRGHHQKDAEGVWKWVNDR
jgi:hypothetical protein